MNSEKRDLLEEIIKEEIQLIKENHKFEAGCLMLDLKYRIKNWKDILKIIDPDDVYDNDTKEYGLEKEPHITVLFGFDKNVVGKNVEDLFEDFSQNVKLQIKGISVFPPREGSLFEVVKFDIVSEDLQKLNEMCRQLPHKNSFPEYHPHMTIAYVKKGTGQRYVKELSEPLLMEANAFKFSSSAKNTTEWKIKKKYRYNIDLNDKGEQ